MLQKFLKIIYIVIINLGQNNLLIKKVSVKSSPLGEFYYFILILLLLFI